MFKASQWSFRIHLMNKHSIQLTSEILHDVEVLLPCGVTFFIPREHHSSLSTFLSINCCKLLWDSTCFTQTNTVLLSKYFCWCSLVLSISQPVSKIIMLHAKFTQIWIFCFKACDSFSRILCDICRQLPLWQLTTQSCPYFVIGSLFVITNFCLLA